MGALSPDNLTGVGVGVFVEFVVFFVNEFEELLVQLVKIVGGFESVILPRVRPGVRRKFGDDSEGGRGGFGFVHGVILCKWTIYLDDN